MTWEESESGPKGTLLLEDSIKLLEDFRKKKYVSGSKLKSKPKICDD